MKMFRGLVLLLASACVVVFCSVNSVTTVRPDATRTETHTETRVGFQPSPWLSFESTRIEEPVVLSNGKPSKEITTDQRRTIAFPTWSWAFAGVALLLFILAKVLKPK